MGSFIGVLGAILIFYLETRRGRVQEQHRRDRELVGLLLLLYVDKDPSGLNVPVFEEYIAELLQSGIIVDRRVQREIRAYDQKYGEKLLDELPDKTLYP